MPTDLYSKAVETSVSASITTPLMLQTGAPNGGERHAPPYLRAAQDSSSFSQTKDAQADIMIEHEGSIIVVQVKSLVQTNVHNRPTDAPTLQETFRQLVDQWHEETEDVSTIGDRFMHSTYQHIIGLGPDAVPLLLDELQREPDYWFWALSAITRENPVHLGSDFDEAVEAWLAWGRERGKI
jgi:hypothetical protein